MNEPLLSTPLRLEAVMLAQHARGQWSLLHTSAICIRHPSSLRQIWAFPLLSLCALSHHVLNSGTRQTCVRCQYYNLLVLLQQLRLLDHEAGL